jgi:hypothetical protein
MGNFSCGTGLFLRLSTASIPRGDGTNDRLSTSMHVDVLDCDTLLALAAVTVEGVGQRCIGAGELVGLVQVFAPRLEGLLLIGARPGRCFPLGDLCGRSRSCFSPK